jgi:hypothetical protein
MIRQRVHGDAGLAPAAVLISSLCALAMSPTNGLT